MTGKADKPKAPKQPTHVKMPIELYNKIGSVLAQLPWNQVNGLIQEMSTQTSPIFEEEDDGTGTS